MDSLTTTHDAAVNLLAQKTSRFDHLEMDQLRVDMRFQRAINVNAVRKIKDDFHPAGVGPLLVARINGDVSYFIVDGQTRFQAMKELGGFTHVVAEIFDELTVSEAALLFRLRNNQKPIPPVQRDRVAVTEGDPIMTEVVRQAAATDYVVFDDDPEKVTMTALTDAKMIVRWGSDKAFQDLLARALLIQAHAFQPVDGTLDGTLDGKILAATAELILHNPNLNDDELARVMADAQLPALQAFIKRKAELEGTRMKSAAKTVLVERYNKGKKGDERIGRN